MTEPTSAADCEHGPDCMLLTCHLDDGEPSATVPLELADDFGGRVQVMHGSVCVGLLIHDKPGLVLTPEQARMLAAMLIRQAEHAEATYA